MDGSQEPDRGSGRKQPSFATRSDVALAEDMANDLDLTLIRFEAVNFTEATRPACLPSAPLGQGAVVALAGWGSVTAGAATEESLVLKVVRQTRPLLKRHPVLCCILQAYMEVDLDDGEQANDCQSAITELELTVKIFPMADKHSFTSTFSEGQLLLRFVSRCRRLHLRNIYYA